VAGLEHRLEGATFEAVDVTTSDSLWRPSRKTRNNWSRRKLQPHYRHAVETRYSDMSLSVGHR
jgi:hypothetical protein